MKKQIITIARQCGSGGHKIGELVAEQLGIPLYDKALVDIVAQRSGYSKETIEREGEYSTTSFLYNIATGGLRPYQNEVRIPDQINAFQTNLIRELADQGPCVIVGRCADYILQDREDCLHVFVHGSPEDRFARVVQDGRSDEAHARSFVLDRDKKRARYYKHITDQVWGASEHYHLCMDTTRLGVERCADIILACL